MSSHTTAILHLPTELLSEILENLDSSLDFRDHTLHNVSLTCRLFHILAQPLIVRDFIVECNDYNIDLPGASRNIARLDFYSSDAIVPFVRTLELNMHSDVLLRPAFSQFATKFFDALPRFVNIRSLYCTGIDFTEFALYQVSTLPSLEYLTISNCSAPLKTDSLPVLRIHSFTCFNHRDPDGVHRFGAQDWFGLLDTDHLQILFIPLTQHTSFFISDIHPSFSGFSSLHSLDLTIDQEVLPMVPMILSKTPVLRSLKLYSSYSPTPQHFRMLEVATACPVPYLNDFQGPHMLLPFILGRAMGSPPAQLRRVFLEGIEHAEDPLDFFINSFQSCHAPQLKAITHIHISLFKSMDLKLLAKVQDMFPVLQVFNLHASECFSSSESVHNPDLTDLYAIPLPCTLVTLSIQWTSDSDAGDVPDLVAAKNHLLPRLPSLRRLWLCDLSKRALQWSRTASQAEECSILDEIDSDIDVWIMNGMLDPQRAFFGP